MHRLSTSFILGYHGCDASVADRVLENKAFKPSNNAYDWLGEGVYFWEANPLRGLEFAVESAKRKGSKIKKPAVVGAVIDLGYCLDLTTSRGLQQVKTAHDRLRQVSKEAGMPMPQNQPDGLRHNLDCAVINYLHRLVAEEKKRPSIPSRASLSRHRIYTPDQHSDQRIIFKLLFVIRIALKVLFAFPKPIWWIDLCELGAPFIALFAMSGYRATSATAPAHLHPPKPPVILSEAEGPRDPPPTQTLHPFLTTKPRRGTASAVP